MPDFYSEIKRVKALRDNIRSRLMKLGIVEDSSAALSECYSAMANRRYGSLVGSFASDGYRVVAPNAYYSQQSYSVEIPKATVAFGSGSVSLMVSYVSEYGIVATVDGDAQISMSVQDGVCLQSGVLSSAKVSVYGSASYLSAMSGQIMPSSGYRSIESGTYLYGDVTVLGDQSLLSENIRNAVTLFGVWGSYSGPMSWTSPTFSENGEYNSDMPSKFFSDVTVSVVSTDDGMKEIVERTLSDLTALSCGKVMGRAFDGFESLSRVILQNPSSGEAPIFTYAFRSCYRLASLYLLGKYSASVSQAFYMSPIVGYSPYGVVGSIYVPSSLYAWYVDGLGYWSAVSSRIVSMTESQVNSLLN